MNTTPRSYSVITQPTHNQHYLPHDVAAHLALRYTALYGGNHLPVLHDIAYCSAQTTNGTYCYLLHAHAGEHAFTATVQK